MSEEIQSNTSEEIQSNTKELANIRLSDEQSKQIAKATGVNVSELTLLELRGEAARALHPSVISGVISVMCW